MRQARHRTQWPKVRPELTQEQRKLFADWYEYHLSTMVPKYGGWVEKFNHSYPLRTMTDNATSLEIGAGTGSHIAFEDLGRHRAYHALELRDELANYIRDSYPEVRVSVADCQERLPFPDRYFDRVLAVHVLEHLENCPLAIAEIHRVLGLDGRLAVVLPCEGGLATHLGRIFTTKRTFERRYGLPYKSFYRYEHINSAREVIAALREYFIVEDTTWYPLAVPSIHLNLVVGLTLRPRPGSD